MASGPSLKSAARLGATAAAVLAAAPLCGLRAQLADSAPPRRPWVAPSHADSTRLLYKGYGYGSDAYHTPVTVLLNKGYEVFQLRHSPRNIWTFPYRTGFHYGIRGVFQHPAYAVERFGGWGRMTRVELLPLGMSINDANWVANYTEHLISGGLTMRMLDEWYGAHGVPLPRLWASVTTYAAAMLNEIMEIPSATEPTAGGVADLLFFDAAAVLFFHWSQPATFFARTLQAANWSNQAALTFPNRQLQNNGEYFSLKVPVGFDRTRLFVRGGYGAQFGFSRLLADGEHHLSVGVGGDTQVRTIDATGHETVRFAPAAGVYYDRNNSLLWAVTTSPAENVLAVNVYPRVLGGVLRDAGLWGVVTRRGLVRLGFVHRGLLGLGVGYGH